MSSLFKGEAEKAGKPPHESARARLCKVARARSRVTARRVPTYHERPAHASNGLHKGPGRRVLLVLTMATLCLCMPTVVSCPLVDTGWQTS
eukprot:4454892-Pleurochrysis_carterae.AAC.3